MRVVMSKKTMPEPLRILEGMDFTGRSGGELGAFRRAVLAGEESLPGMGQSEALEFRDEYMASRDSFAREGRDDHVRALVRNATFVVVGALLLGLFVANMLPLLSGGR